MAVSEPIIFQKATPLPPSLNPQVLYSWKAPLRAYKKRSKYVLRFYLAVALLLTAIIFFLGDQVLIVPIWAILFLFYVLTITPPPLIENRITKFGIETAGITLRWEILSHFYFTTRFNFSILTLVTQAPYYMHAYMVLPSDKIKKDVMKILAEHIVYQENPHLGVTDRLINLLSHLIPEDEEGESIPAKIMMKPQSHEKIEEVKDTLASFFQKKRKTTPSSPSVSPTL